MATTVENRVSMMELDASGFIRNAQAALKSLAELDGAFEMKGAARAAQTMGDSMSAMRQTIGAGAQAAASEMAVIGEAAEKAASRSGGAFGRFAEEASASAGTAGEALSEAIDRIDGFRDAVSGAYQKIADGMSAKMAEATRVTAEEFGRSEASARQLGNAIANVFAYAADSDAIRDSLSANLRFYSEYARQAADDTDKLRYALNAAFSDTKAETSWGVEDLSGLLGVIAEDFFATEAEARRFTEAVSASFADISRQGENAFDGLASQIATDFSGARSAAETFVSQTASAAEHMADSSAQAMDTVSEAASEAGGIVGTAMSKAGKAAGAALEDIPDSARKSVTAATRSVETAMGDMRQVIGAGARGSAEEMAAVSEAAEKTASSSGVAFDQMAAQIATDFAGAQTAAEGFAVQTASSIQGLTTGTEGVSASLGTVAQAARDAGTAVQEGFGGAQAAAMNVANSAAYAAGNVSAAVSQADMAAQTAGADISASAQQSAANAENAFANIGGRAEQIGQQMSTGAQTGFAAAEASAAAAAAGIAVKLGLITAAVGVTTLGIYALVTSKGESIRQSVHNVCEGVHDKIVGVKDKIHTAVTNGIEAVKKAFEEGNLGPIREKFHEAFDKGKQAAEQVLASLKKTLEFYFPETSAFIEKALTELKGKFETKLDEIRNSVKSRVDEIRNELNFLKEGASGKMEEIGEGVRSRLGALKDNAIGLLPWNKNNEEEPAPKRGAMAGGYELNGQPISELGKGAEEAKSKVDELNASLDKTKEASTEAGEEGRQGMTQLANAEGQAADGAQNMADGLENAADGAQNMADGLENAAGAAVENAEAADGAAANADKLRNAQTDVAEGSGDAQGSLDDLNETVKKNQEKTEEATKATKEAAEATKDAAKEAEDYGKEAKKAGEKTEEAAEKGTEAGKGLSGLFKALHSDISGLQDKADEAAAAGSAFGSVASAALIAGPILIKKYREGLQDQTEDTDKLRDAMAALGDKAAAVYDKMQGLVASVSNSITGLINKVEEFGKKVAKEFTVDQVKAGWAEYELKMGSVQTIMAGTGASLEEVNKRLDELNAYADRTIYIFSDMTSNIGKFTNQGVKLEDAVEAIKGIANEAALSGANAQQASHAMYNFAQALSTGYIQNIDWKSIENAMMATTEFKQQLIETAFELGTLEEAEKEAGDETTKFVSTTTDNTGHISEAFDAMSGFRDSLKAQWLTSDVLIKTLKKYTNETTDLGKAAYAAAQDVKTGSQLMDTLKEAIGSGWAKTFELIVGDFEAAKKFWTGVNNTISPILDAISDWRNTLVEKWAKLGGRQNLIEGMKTAFEGLKSTVGAVTDALGQVFSRISASKIKTITDRIASFAAKLAPTKDQLSQISDIFVKLFDGMRSVWKAAEHVVERVQMAVRESGALKSLGDAFGFITGSGEEATGALDRLLNTVESIVDRVKAFLQEGIADTIRKHASDIKSLVEGVMSVLSAAKSVAEKFFSMRFDSLTSLIQKVLNVALSAVNVIGKITKAVGDFIRKNDQLVASAIRIVKLVLKVKGVLAIAVPLIKGIATKVGALVGTVTMAVNLAISAKKILPLVISSLKLLKTRLAASTTAVGQLGAAMLKTGLQTAVMTAAITAAILVIAGIVYAIAKAKQKYKEMAEATYGLTEAEEAYGERLKETVDEYREMAVAREEAVKSAVDEYENYGKLLDELQEITDANGHIKDGYQDRADVLLGELKDGLDIEYNRTGDIIDNYDELIGKIDDLIKKKKTEAILMAAYDEYKSAADNVTQHSRDISLLQDQYDAAVAELEQLKKGAAKMSFDQALANMDALEQRILDISTQLADAKEAYYRDMTAITNYEALENAANAGADYTEQLLALTYGVRHAANVSKEALETQLREIAVHYRQLVRAYETETNDKVKARLAGEITEALKVLDVSLKEAEAGGADYMDALAKGLGVGQDDVVAMFGNLGVAANGAVEDDVNYLSAYYTAYNYILGLSKGLSDGTGQVENAAGSVADAVTDTVTDKWKIHSPSRVAERQTEMFGQGMVNGLQKTLRDVREESRTLSEAVTESTAQAFAAAAEMAEADFSATMTVTPVIDLTDVHRSAEAISDAFGATERLTVNGKLYAGVAAEREKTEPTNGSDPLLTEVRSLRAELRDVSSKVGSMQMRIDGKTLIGWIAPAVDAELGAAASEKNRGL